MNPKTFVYSNLFFLLIGVILIQFGCDKTEENKAPTCTITSPNNEDEIDKGELITISVDADDTDGNVTEVLLYVDGSIIANMRSFPYTFDWNASSQEVGSHTIKATAKDNSGSSSSDEINISLTSYQPAALTTVFLSDYTETSAQCGGNITDDGGTTVTARGVCWSIFENPTVSDDNTTDGSGTGIYASSITGLTSDTRYFVRAYATNKWGTQYGQQVILKTYSGTVTDIDGNVYYTVTIGTQTWMAENLRTTKYNDDTAIPLITINNEWEDRATPAYCWYNNDEASYKNTYGALYNWHAINTGKLSPTGWHVPSETEWQTLVDYVGASFAARILKEAGNTHWYYPTSEGTNESGFTALPGGVRSGYDGTFNAIGITGRYWTTTGGTDKIYYMISQHHSIFQNFVGPPYDGCSLRCIKD